MNPGAMKLPMLEMNPDQNDVCDDSHDVVKTWYRHHAGVIIVFENSWRQNGIQEKRIGLLWPFMIPMTMMIPIQMIPDG